MVTVYGSGTTISCPNTGEAPPPVGQLIVIGTTVGEAVAVGPTVSAPDDGAGLLEALGGRAEDSDPPAMLAITLPTAAPPRATAPMTTPSRWLRFFRSSRRRLAAQLLD